MSFFETDRDVGSISNLGGGGKTLQGHFFIKLKGLSLNIKRALLCLLQNLGGGSAPVPPVATSLKLDTQK